MSRIERRLHTLAQRGDKALAMFVTAGYPDLTSTIPNVQALVRGGADIIELGMPFSDPIADGPVIQESSHIALKNGITLKRILDDVAAIRKQSDVPLILMGYLNPLMAFGEERFFRCMAEAGADGIILPELPLEEIGRYSPFITRNGLSQILLVTPTTAADRITAIDGASNGFLYCVSTTGVTGGRSRAPVQEYLKRVKRQARKNAVLVGFGVSTPEDVHNYAQAADGVIIGSALIKRLGQGLEGEPLSAWVRGMKEALS